MLYHNLSTYLKDRYHGKIRKICIDGGFTCPNRDGTCGVGGCIFCGERGAGEHIGGSGLSISDQVRSYFDKAPKGDGFIAYFQNYTNTYAPVSVLKERYDAALIDSRIVALAVGTRPDCISEENAELLASYRSKCDVWVELGLQTANEETAKRINRGYDNSAFERAVRILSERQIPIVVHILIGLPGETFADTVDTTAYLNRFRLWGLKIHCLYVMRGTVLEKLYLQGAFRPQSMKEYADAAAYVLSHISPEIVIHRLTGDCPKGLLAAPEWNTDKNAILREITRTMEANGWTQGCLYPGGD